MQDKESVRRMEDKESLLRLAAAEVSLDRRRLLQMGMSAAVVAVLPAGCLTVPQDESEQLLQRVSDSPRPLDGERLGSLDDAQFETLAGLPRFVDQGWALQTDLDPYLERLRSDLEHKTKYAPSYLTEYEHAVELIHLVSGSRATSQEAWSALLFAEFEAADLAATKLGRARRFVFDELVTHQIPISGAFKGFGLVNYRGYFGGPFADPASYRRGETPQPAEED